MKSIKIKPFISDKLKEDDINDILDKIDQKSIIIFSVHSPAHAEIVKKVYERNKNIIIINLLHPYNIKGLTMIKTVLATYSDNNAQVRAACEVLFKGPWNDPEIEKKYRIF